MSAVARGWFAMLGNVTPIEAEQERLPRVAAWERVTDLPLTVLALVFLGAYAWPILDPSLPASTHHVLVVVDITTWLLFATDYFGRLAIAEDRPLFFRRNLLDLFTVVLPPARPLRLLRVALILMETLNRHTRTRPRRKLAVFIAGSATLLITLSSLAVLDAERGAAGGRINDYGDALWWSAVTATTVGYGDVYPVTVEGRFVAVCLMLGGIGLIGYISGSVTSWVVEKVSDVSETARETGHDVDALLVEVRRLNAEMDRLHARLDARPAVPAEPSGRAAPLARLERGALGVAGLDTELVALGVAQHHEAPDAVGRPVVGEDRGAQLQQPLHLLIPGGVGTQVEVDPVLDRLAFRHLDEQQPRQRRRRFDEYLFVARFIDVRDRPAGDLTPERAQLIGVGTVDGDVPDGRDHGVSLIVDVNRTEG